MTQPQYVVAVILAGLGCVAFFMIKQWAKNWEARLLKQDTRLDNHDKRHNEHDVKHAEVTTHLEHIRETSEETRSDVKKLLRINGNSRAS